MSFKKDTKTVADDARPDGGGGIAPPARPGKAAGRLQYPCTRCPLRPLEAFREFTEDELAFVSTFKKGELNVERGATVLLEGSSSAHLYTILSGIGFRYKLLHDGRRQILNYVMPGDLIGLQSGLIGEMQHSVEALSPLLLCVFERNRMNELFRDHPGLAFDITWIASREEQMLDENLLSIGRRSAVERAAYLIAFLSGRIRTRQEKGLIPITQQHVADTLGLSLVHTNRTLKRLADRGLIHWRDGGCEVRDAEGLARLARWEPVGETQRPFV
jgi:CRP-like cAMP-binding protein